MADPPCTGILWGLGAVLGGCPRVAAALAAAFVRRSAWAERPPVGHAPDLPSGPSDSESTSCDSDHTVPDSVSAPSPSLASGAGDDIDLRLPRDDCVWTTHSEADAALVAELASLDRLAAEQAAEQEREIEDYPVACPLCGQTYG